MDWDDNAKKTNDGINTQVNTRITQIGEEISKVTKSEKDATEILFIILPKKV